MSLEAKWLKLRFPSHSNTIQACSMQAVALIMSSHHLVNIASTQGFFVPYLTGGISIVVLALGSTAPGLLGFFINKFSAVFPDYRERVLGHEAAHFLVSHCLERWTEPIRVSIHLEDIQVTGFTGSP